MGGELDDVEQLKAEFPQWFIEKRWQTAGSGPDGATLTAKWGMVKVTAHSADELRRQIREAGG